MADIPTKTLGKTGLDVSIMGFGAATLGNLYGDIDKQTGIDAVHAAIDRGINFIDTSPYYGVTLSETRLGEALRGHRDKVVLATKCGRYDIDKFDFTEERLLKSVDESLARLETDWIDVFFLHDIEFWDKQRILDEALPALEKIKASGKARFIGFTGYPVAMLFDVLKQYPVDVILSYCHYNLLTTTLNNNLAPYATDNSIGLVNASTLHMGVLTNEGAQAWHPAPQPVHDVAKQVADFLHERGSDIVDMALQFALQNPHVATTLVGMKTVAEVEHNIDVMTRKLDTELLAQVQAMIDPVKDIHWQTGLPENDEPDAQPIRETD